MSDPANARDVIADTRDRLAEIEGTLTLAIEGGGNATDLIVDLLARVIAITRNLTDLVEALVDRAENNPPG